MNMMNTIAETIPTTKFAIGVKMQMKFVAGKSKDVTVTTLPFSTMENVSLRTTDKRTDFWSRPSCIYTQIFSPKKTGFSPIKNTFQKNFDFCLPLFYATFQCGP
jgi:hypothetical protein